MRPWALLAVLLLIGCSSQPTSVANPVLFSKANDIAYSLEQAGIFDFYIEMSKEKVVVHYEQPPVKSDADVILAWTYIWTSVPLYHPNSEEIVIVQYIDRVPVVQSTVETDHAAKLSEKDASFVDFVKNVERKAPPEEAWACPAHSALIGGGCYCLEGYEGSDCEAS